MLPRSSHVIALALVAIASALIAVFPGCSNQGEGERCSTQSDNNGNDDCKDGLICIPAGQLNGAGNTTDRCCPADRTTATTVACQLPSGGGIDAAPPPVDASGADVSVEGGGKDAQADGEAGGPADAGGDAPSDAPADG